MRSQEAQPDARDHTRPWRLPRGHLPAAGQVLGASTTETRRLHPWHFAHQETPFWSQGVTGLWAFGIPPLLFSARRLCPVQLPPTPLQS